MQTRTITIPAAEADEIQGWLDTDKQVPDSGRDEVLRTYTAIFDDGVESDIKVCNGDTGPYIDSVMFEDGNEIGFLEVRDTLLGVYDFRDDQECYRVIVEKGA